MRKQERKEGRTDTETDSKDCIRNYKSRPASQFPTNQQLPQTNMEPHIAHFSSRVVLSGRFFRLHVTSAGFRGLRLELGWDQALGFRDEGFRI